MNIFKIFLCITVLSTFGTDTMAAGLSAKIDHGRELQNMIESEAENLDKLNKKHHERINWNNELKLNDIQKIYYKKILQESRKQTDEQVKTINNAHKEIDKIYKDENIKIRQILTPQQQIKFDRALYRWKKAHGAKDPGNKPSLKRMRQY